MSAYGARPARCRDAVAEALIAAVAAAPIVLSAVCAVASAFVDRPAPLAFRPAEAPIETTRSAHSASTPPLRAVAERRAETDRPILAAAEILATEIHKRRAASRQVRQLGPDGQSIRLPNAVVGEDFQLSSDDQIVHLAGVDQLPAGKTCRRLDGVVEDCAVRAANRLRVVTIGRPVVCFPFGTDEELRLMARCFAGKIDLARDLISHGLATASRDQSRPIS